MQWNFGTLREEKESDSGSVSAVNNPLGELLRELRRNNEVRKLCLFHFLGHFFEGRRLQVMLGILVVGVFELLKQFHELTSKSSKITFLDAMASKALLGLPNQ